VVYVLDNNNHVQQRSVDVGMEGSKLAEIRSGLQPGEKVIVGGQEKYQEGEEVNPEVQRTDASEMLQETGGTIDLKGEQALGDEGAAEPGDPRRPTVAGEETGVSGSAPPGRRSSERKGGAR
jgi:hypothetical protein